MEHIGWSHSDYLHNVMRPEKLKATADKCTAVLAKYEYDAIAFRGMSGALIAPVLSFLTGKPLLMVRKPKSVEDGHSFYRVEGYSAAKHYVIVDDLISSGDTIRQIKSLVRSNFPEAECIGILLYNDLPDLAECAAYPLGAPSVSGKEWEANY